MEDASAGEGELQRCRCCGERRPACKLLADAFRPEASAASLAQCDYICARCHGFVGNLLEKILSKKTHDSVLRYWLAAQPVSLPRSHVFIHERVEGMLASTSGEHLRKVQGLVPYVPGLVIEYLAERWASSCAGGGKENPGAVAGSAQALSDINDTLDAVILMADVTGYTALAERLCAERGVNAGVEAVVSNCLNKYFTKLVGTIHEYGGDVVKFAGDAVLCVWRPQMARTKRMATDSEFARDQKQQALAAYAQAALLCAFKCKSMVERVQVAGEEKVLRLHCGLSCGKVSVISVGTGDNREILLTGSSLRRAGDAVAFAAAETVVVCHNAWRLVRTITLCQPVLPNKGNSKILKFFGEEAPPDAFGDGAGASQLRRRAASHNSASNSADRSHAAQAAELLAAAHAQAHAPAKALDGGHGGDASRFWLVKQITVSPELGRAERGGLAVLQQRMPPVEVLLKTLESYIPVHVTRQLKGRQRIQNDVRLVSTLFLNISNESKTIGYETDPGQLMLLQEIFSQAQRVVNHYEGMVRQFIVDDKGCVLIVVFGVSCYRHTDDASRALCTAFDLQRALHEVGGEGDRIKTNVGITTGRAFCGPIGSRRGESITRNATKLHNNLALAGCCKH